MNTRIRLLLLCGWAALVANLTTARAQWLTQSFDLKAGWNAVFLHVDPSHATIGELLATDPDGSIEEIWMWKPAASSQQFVQSPQLPSSTGSQWVNWSRVLGDGAPLQKLIPNAAYLVRVRTEIANYAWQLKGRAVVPRYQWSGSGLNFLGFPTAPVAPPSFDDFLALAPTEFQRTAEVYRYPGGDLGPGNPGRVFALRTTPVRRGEAYWIRAGEVYNHYYGPFEVVAGGSGMVAYGESLSTVSVRLRNLTASPLTVTLNLIASEAPPSGLAPIAGVPPLLVRGEPNSTNLTYGYAGLPVGTSQSWSLAPFGQDGSERELVLGLDRSVLAGSEGDVLAGLLRFTDSLDQNQVDVGVTASIGSAAGLWVGGAAVTQVGQYLKSYDRDAANNPVVLTNGQYSINGTNTSLGAVPTTYPLRLVVHNPAAGPAMMFQRIFFGFNAATNPIVANREASLNRNLLSEARRISVTHLPWSEENAGWSFDGALAQGASVTVSVTNAFNNHTSNPFLHTYHPDHDNLDVRFQNELPQGSESYTIVRDITLNVSPPSDDFDSRTAAGKSFSGSYVETIRLLGLARAGNTFDTRTFRVTGIFTLNRISEVATVTHAP